MEMDKINTIKIREPIWWNKSVGLAVDKLTDITRIEILFRDKLGNRVFPHPYIITKEKALRYSSESAKRNSKVELKIVPISALTIEGENKCLNLKK